MRAPRVSIPVLVLAAGLAAAPIARAADLPADGIYGDHIDQGGIMDLNGPASRMQITWTNGFKDCIRW